MTKTTPSRFSLAKSIPVCRQFAVALLLAAVVCFDVSAAQSSSFNSWRPVTPTPLSPKSLAFHASSFVYPTESDDLTIGLDSSTVYLIVHGGITSFSWRSNADIILDSVYTSEFWAFDVLAAVWFQAHDSNSPSARAFHTLSYAAIEGHSYMVLFGGCNATTPAFGGTWLLKAQTLNWTLLDIPASQQPSPRWGHHMMSLGGGTYLLYGGAQGYTPVTDTVWIMSIVSDSNAGATVVWTQPTQLGAVPPLRLLGFGAVIQPETSERRLLLMVASGWDGNITNVACRSDSYIAWLELDTSPTNITWQFTGNDAPALVLGKSFYLNYDNGTSFIVTYQGSFLGNILAKSTLFIGSLDQVFAFYPSTLQWQQFNNTIAGASVQTALFSPEATIGSSIRELHSTLFLYGGYDTFSESVMNSLFVGTWSFATGKWALFWTPVQSRSAPPSRTYAMAVSDTTQLLIIGGWTTRFQIEADFWAFSYETETWRQVSMLGAQLPAIAESSAVFLPNGFAILFGGSYQTLNGQLYFYNTTYGIFIADQVVVLLCDGTAPSTPPARSNHASVLYDDTHIVLFGGTNCRNTCLAGGYTDLFFNDVHLFDFNTFSWSPIEIVGTLKPPARAGLSASVMGGPEDRALYVLGGYDEHYFYADFWQLNFATRQWRRLPLLEGSPQAFIECVYTTLGAPYGSVFVVYGGVNNFSTTQPALSTHIFSHATGQWMHLPVSDALNQFPAAPGQVGAALQPWDSFIQVYGGQGTALSSSLSLIRLGCNAGSFSPNFSSVPCQLCPLGTFSAAAGATSCNGICPAGTTTSQPGATVMAHCDKCLPGQCKRGDCSVVAGLATVTTVCRCSFGYQGTQCDLPVIWIVVGVLLGVAILVSLGLFIYRKLQLSVGYYKLKSSLKEKLLDETKMELSELEKVWHIDAEDIHFEEQAGIGTYGEVWKAQWNGRQVAVKKLHSFLLELDDESVAMFEHEVKFLRTLRHKNIVFFYGAGEIDQVPFLVVEYCAFGALNDMLSDEKRELPWTRLQSFALDAAQGMRFLHGLRPPRLHRDLKCANIFITANWEAKVGDFGSSRLFKVRASNQPPSRHASSASEMPLRMRSRTQQSLAEAHMTGRVGTVAWAAPEVMSNQKGYGTSADVFSFGICMWELATRETPFSEIRSVFDLEARVQRGERPSLAHIPAHVPRAYITLMEKCWRHMPQSRPSFTDVVVELAALSSSGPELEA